MLAKPQLFRLLTWLAALLLATAVLQQLPLIALPESIATPTVLQWLSWTLVNILTIAVLVIRWQLLTGALGLVTGFIPLLLVRQAGQLVSFITPGPQFGGEPLQVYWLWKNYRLAGHAALLAVGLDRFFELWVNFAVLLGAVLLLLATSTIGTDAWKLMAIFLTVLMMSLSIVGLFLIKHPERISAGLQRLTRRWQDHAILGQLETHWNRISRDLLVVTRQQKPALIMALLLSLLGWAGMLAELWLLLTIFFPQPDFTDLLVIFVVIRAAFLLPLPGGIGTLEAALFWACQGLGLPVTAALGLIVFMRLRDAVVMGGGLIALRYLNAHIPR